MINKDHVALLKHIYNELRKQNTSLKALTSGGGGGGDATAANQVIQITELGNILTELSNILAEVTPNATEAKQDDIITAINSLITNIGTGLATEVTLQDIRDGILTDIQQDTLSLNTKLNKKFTGIELDLNDDLSGNYPGFNFDLVSLRIVIPTEGYDVTVEVAGDVNNSTELAAKLNEVTDAIIFEESSGDLLRFKDGVYLASNVSEINIEDGGGNTYILDSSNFTSIVNTDPKSNLDCILEKLTSIENKITTANFNANATRFNTYSASTIVTPIYSGGDDVKEIIIFNDSNRDVFVGIGFIPTTSNFSFRLSPDDIWVDDNPTNITYRAVANGFGIGNINVTVKYRE